MSVIEQYKDVFDRVNSINNEIKHLEAQKEAVWDTFSKEVGARIEKLEDSLKKIDEYQLKVRAYQQEAKKHLDSQNVLTVEAPPGYRVNLNRLRNWAMMIDPTSDNDPYAQRVYSVACCDELFLEQKKNEFTSRIALLKSQQNDGADEEVTRIEAQIKKLKDDLKNYASGKAMAELSEAVMLENRRFNYISAPNEYTKKKVVPESIYPGVYLASLPFAKEQRNQLHNKMGDCYDADSGYLSVPVGIINSSEFIMNILCSPLRKRREELYEALQNLIFASVDNNPAGTRKVYFYDAARFMPSTLGSLRKMEGSFVLEPIPTSPDQLTDSLEKLVSGFADIDEMLGLNDSVSGYNSTVEDPSLLIPMTTVVLMGWPTSYEGRNLELILRMMNSYERYGISIITVNYKTSDDGKEDPKMPEFAYQNSIKIRMFNKDTSIQFADGVEQRFKWYRFKGEITDHYVDTLKSNIITKGNIGNEYLKRYPISDMPVYTRKYVNIELPFGIDGKDDAHKIAFENDNFATFLMGASRSGKSTLLHTLLAGLIYNYHPDNLEIWLADFKQLEFKRYIKHLPPHVKYVLLDESTELVYDLVDKLTAEMMERQKIFGQEGVDKLYELDATKLSKPMPVIFVILDEFSIMSQSIAESPAYKLKLQNILAKGAALGIKFIFASQTFTTGVSGLSSTARAQIQQRIAMKGAKEEISETLELSSNMKTDQVKNWMDALPPHYALVKFRRGPDLPPEVRRYLVMYFTESDYKLRDKMIDDLRNRMIKTDCYNPDDINSYVDKHPVLVDGNTYDLFPNEEFKQEISHIIKTDETYSGEEIYLTFGTPRLMERMKISCLTSETRENILLIARAAEQACSSSIIVSAINSVINQGIEVKVLAYSKNKLFRSYKPVFETFGIQIIEDMDNICDEIRSIKQSIIDKKSTRALYVLIGIERICMDFEYEDGSVQISNKPSNNQSIRQIIDSFAKAGAVAVTEEEIAKKHSADEWVSIRLKIKAECKQKNLSVDETKAIIEKEKAKFFASNDNIDNISFSTNNVTQKTTVSNVEPSKVVESTETVKEASGAYNASADFVFIIKQGSRLGYHFMITLNSFADIKQCGLKPDFFRYKMAFQLSVDDSRNLFNNKIASTLPEHICQFDDSLEKYSFRPYIQPGVGWDGWFVNDKGELNDPYKNSNEE